ncbi:universal stress protein [Azospirillum sp. INR13]|uniref:universal stress protein n=1 Tax=Azospirillum sp. INR13 TaxID=2596919 RepID=UPI001892817D|nr:universal stress protein [Azospirillum sp. INR13]
MKTILIATDLSARSDRALDRALMLSRERDAHLVVLYVVDGGPSQEAIKRRQVEAAEAIGAYLEARGGEPKPDIRITVGTPDREILRCAAEIGADLIVLGAHRVAPEDDTFRDSTAWNVLRQSDPPVLLVKDAALKPYRRATVGFDFSRHAEAALRLAFRFRPEEVAVVHAYHVPYEGFLYGSDTHGDYRERCQENLSAAVQAVMPSVRCQFPVAVEPQCLLSHGETLGSLWQECQRMRTDLLVIGTHGRTGLAHAVFGSVAEFMLRNPPCDVVAVRPPAGAAS